MGAVSTPRLEVLSVSGLELEIDGAERFPGIEVEVRASDLQWVAHRSNRVLGGESLTTYSTMEG